MRRLLRPQSGNLKWICFLIFNFVIITFVGFPFVEIVRGLNGNYYYYLKSTAVRYESNISIPLCRQDEEYILIKLRQTHHVPRGLGRWSSSLGVSNC